MHVGDDDDYGGDDDDKDDDHRWRCIQFQMMTMKVEASTNQVADHQMPVYHLPSKILCRVMNVHLKAAANIDEIFTQMTLLPILNQDENAVEKEPLPTPPPRPHVHSFCKTLTGSDTSTLGGFSMLRLHADECLSLLDSNGDIYDCVDMYKQPTFDHPLLKYHTSQVKILSDKAKEILMEESNI